jgi:PAS domain-containing protein
LFKAAVNSKYPNTLIDLDAALGAVGWDKMDLKYQALESENDGLKQRVQELETQVKHSVTLRIPEGRRDTAVDTDGFPDSDDRTLADSLLEGCQIIGFDWRYSYLNGVAEVHNRRSNHELLGQRYMDAWPGIEGTEVFRRIKTCLESRHADRMESEFTYPDGEVGWFELVFNPVPRGVLILSLDITEPKRLQLRLSQLNQLLKAIRDVNHLIVRERDPARLVQTACEILASRFRRPRGLGRDTRAIPGGADARRATALRRFVATAAGRTHRALTSRIVPRVLVVDEIPPRRRGCVDPAP